MPTARPYYILEVRLFRQQNYQVLIGRGIFWQYHAIGQPTGKKLTLPSQYDNIYSIVLGKLFVSNEYNMEARLGVTAQTRGLEASSGVLCRYGKGN